MLKLINLFVFSVGTFFTGLLATQLFADGHFIMSAVFVGTLYVLLTKGVALLELRPLRFPSRMDG